MPDDIRVFCNSCRQITRHVIQNNFEQVKDDGSIIQWQIIQCAGCDDVSCRSKLIFVEGIDLEDDNPIIFPTRLIRIAKQFDGLDAQLDRIYREMIDAFNSESNILCAGGLRALVEGICAEQNVTDGPKRNHKTGNFIMKKNGDVQRGRTLDCKIEGLAERQILTLQLARTLHEHRYLGNAALHELEVPTRETLNTAINIVEHILEALHNIPAQADILMRRRANNPGLNSGEESND